MIAVHRLTHPEAALYINPDQIQMIEGNPDLTCELTVGQPATASDDGMVATTMRLVNAIPYVCDAPPGLVSSLDLPLTTPRFAFD